MDQTFATISTALRFDRSVARPQVGPAGTTAPAAGTLLSYAVGGPSFTFRLQNPTYPVDRSQNVAPAEYAAVFGPAQRSSDPALTNARITTWQSAPGDTLTLSQLNPGSGNDLLALNYAGMGIVKLQHDLTPLVHEEVRPFTFFSQVTPASSLPDGTVTYTGVIAGFATPKDGRPAAGTVIDATTPPGYAYTISGTVRITVNFATRTYTGTLTVNAVRERDPTATVSFGDVSLGSGSVSDTSFAGTLDGGSLLGSFAGPNGQELGGTLLVTIFDANQNNVPLSLVSAFVAKR